MTYKAMLTPVLLFMITVRGLDGACPTDVDVCSPDNYVELDDPDRSSDFNVIENDSAESDFSLDENWYRSVSGAGGDIPTEVVYTGQCNAIAPIWIDDILPSVAVGIVEVVGCASFLDDNCTREYNIPVRNCGEFNVYCLGPTVDAYDRFCMGTQGPCPEGQVSDNGFTPCGPEEEVDLTLVNDPEITVQVEYELSAGQWLGGWCEPYYIFECNIDHDDARTFYDVQWYANDNLIFEFVDENGLSSDEMPSQVTSTQLIQENYYIGTTLKCRVTPKSGNGNEAVYGAFTETEFFAGIDVSDSSQFIEVQEGGPPAYYNATFTIPFRCSFLTFNGACEATGTECSDGNGIGISRVSNGNGQECTSDNDVTVQIDQGDPDGCIIGAYEWGFSLKVNANPDHVYNPRRQIVLQLQTTEGEYSDFWAGYELPRATVFINDAELNLRNRYCVVSNDPHIISFDGTRYTDVQMTGIFLLYKHRTLPISVEVYFTRFSDRYTSNCGGAVRSGGEVFVFDACNEDEPWRVSAYECEEGLRNMVVTQYSSYQYQVTLPTGTRVILGLSRQYVYPSVFDWEQTEGLCGYLNGIDSDADDKIIRGTNIVDTPTPSPVFGTSYMEYNAFSNSYRVPDEESLYFGVVTDDLDYDDISFCVCSGNDDDPGASCSATPNSDCVAGSHTEASGNSHRCTYSRRRKRDVNGVSELDDTPNSIFEYDPTFVARPAGWINGWTNETAYEHCQNVFLASSSVQTCSNVPNLDVDGSVMNCVADIYITGESVHSQIHVDSILNICQNEVARYDFESENDTDLPVSPDLAREILNEVCDNDCSGHGTCQQGLCVCEEGYTDIDCGSDLNHIPILFDLPNSGLCDLSVRPCELINVYADAYVADSVWCKLQLRNQNGENIGDALILPAEYMHEQRVVCPISLDDFGESRWDVIGFYMIDISTSNNGDEFSDSKRLTVFNGECYACSDGQCISSPDVCQYTDVCYNNTESPADAPCYRCNGQTQEMEVEDGFCYIINQCYNHGDANPDESSEYCDTNEDIFEWFNEGKKSKSNPGSDDMVLIIIIVVVIVGLAGITIAVIVAIKVMKGSNKTGGKQTLYNRDDLRTRESARTTSSSRPETPGDINFNMQPEEPRVSQLQNGGGNVDRLVVSSSQGGGGVDEFYHQAPTNHAMAANQFPKKTTAPMTAQRTVAKKPPRHGSATSLRSSGSMNSRHDIVIKSKYSKK